MFGRSDNQRPSTLIEVDGRWYRYIPWADRLVKPPTTATIMHCGECGQSTWVASKAPVEVIDAILTEHQVPHVLTAAEKILQEASS